MTMMIKSVLVYTTFVLLLLLYSLYLLKRVVIIRLYAIRAVVVIFHVRSIHYCNICITLYMYMLIVSSDTLQGDKQTTCTQNTTCCSVYYAAMYCSYICILCILVP